MRPSGSPETLEKRRERAIELLEQGLMPVEVAGKVGVDRRSVRRWKAAYRAKGKNGIKAVPASGRPPKLSAADKKKLEKTLLKGARSVGFPTDLWTCPRIAEVIKKRFAISYHVDHVCRLLHSMGWSPQRPTRVAIERDEPRIAQWIREDWPRAKKKPAH